MKKKLLFQTWILAMLLMTFASPTLAQSENVTTTAELLEEEIPGVIENLPAPFQLASVSIIAIAIVLYMLNLFSTEITFNQVIGIIIATIISIIILVTMLL